MMISHFWLKLEKVAPLWDTPRSTTKIKRKGASDEIRHEKEEKATRGFKKVYGKEKLIDQMFHIL